MHTADIDIKVRALIEALGVRGVIILLGIAIFLVWNWGELLPGLEHLMLTLRTAIMKDVAEDVMVRISQTLIPFGLMCSRLMVTTLLCWGLIHLINRAEWLGYDWDENIKTLKKEKKQKAKKLEADITNLDILSEQTAHITAVTKDFEILADLVKRLKLEANKPAKIKAEPDKSDPKTAELFLHKPNGKPPPSQPKTPKPPEF